MELLDGIFSIKSENDFENIAFKVYEYQIKNNPIYRQFVQQLNWKKPTQLKEIPFLPIEFFKTQQIITENHKPEIVFKSSGTGGIRSKHYVADLSVYEHSFNKCYNQFIGQPEDQVIFALLPNYLEQGESSLVYMVEKLIQQTKNPLSGFYLQDAEEFYLNYSKAIKEKKQIILFGVSYALLDLIEKGKYLDEAIIIETGGMKGRRKELTKKELHSILKEGLNCQSIYSEYGMTELLSQAYCKSDLLFKPPPWMKALIRDTNDPFSYLSEGKIGGINIIDLANINSCSFIATQDLGKIKNNGFEILGRFDQADIRGCNLLVV